MVSIPRFNPRNFNPRKIIFGAFFGQNFIPQSATPIRLVSKCSKFTNGSFKIPSKLPETSHLRFRPRKSQKVDFQFENSSAQYWYLFEWYLKLILFGILELSKIHCGWKAQNSRNSTYLSRTDFTCSWEGILFPPWIPKSFNMGYLDI